MHCNKSLSPQIDKIMSSIGAGIGTEVDEVTESHSGMCVLYSFGFHTTLNRYLFLEGSLLFV